MEAEYSTAFFIISLLQHFSPLPQFSLLIQRMEFFLPYSYLLLLLLVCSIVVLAPTKFILEFQTLMLFFMLQLVLDVQFIPFLFILYVFLPFQVACFLTFCRQLPWLIIWARVFQLLQVKVHFLLFQLGSISLIHDFPSPFLWLQLQQQLPPSVISILI